MRIEIRKKKDNTAILISFDTLKDKFESLSERNRFFWELHGRKQVVIKQSGRYEYNKEGLLEEIPNIKVADSVFIVAMEHMKRMQDFFKEWQDKVEFESFPVLLDERKRKELEEREVHIE
ncbi:MAG: hypothetical protein V1678_02065 [Candidatus Aenigmatarchaeota archaeon]